MNKIIYVDNFSTKNFQEIFNVSSLKMMSDVFDEVVYYTSKSNKVATYGLFNEVPKNIKYRFIPIIGFSNALGNVIRHIFPIITSLYVILRTKKKDVIYFNYNVLWAMPFINFLSKTLNKKVVLMCHGEMEYLTNGVKINVISDYFLKRFLSKSFKLSRSLYFCVLGEHIKKNLKILLPQHVSDKFLFFNHSHVFKTIAQKNKIISSEVNIGLVGTVRSNKWLSSIIELGQKIKDSPHINFTAIGRVYCDVQTLHDVGINIVNESDSRFLSRNEMDNAISKLDYVVFLYPKESYKFTASGALFDAIDQEKQILALKNDYFNSIFKHCPQIGKLFNNIEELSNYIKSLNTNQSSSLDFEYVKLKLGTIKAGEMFKKQLDIIKI